MKPKKQSKPKAAKPVLAWVVVNSLTGNITGETHWTRKDALAFAATYVGKSRHVRRVEVRR